MKAIVLLFSAFSTAFIITSLVIPIIVQLAFAKGLVAKPNERSSHRGIVPNLGGLGIFMGFILSFILFSNFAEFPNMQYFLFSAILIFFIGMKDDVSAISAGTKFMGLTLAIAIPVILGNIRITSFYGIFGITTIHPLLSILFTIFVFLVIINAYNLIDGINGLCGTLTSVSLCAFGLWFWFEKNPVTYQYLILITSLLGAVLGFLRFNFTPAKIFMGDTGSLMLGFITAFITVYFIERGGNYTHPIPVRLSPVVAIGFIAIPLADMLKVFIIRIYRKRSPFQADKRHVHHLLVDLGLSHTKATLIIASGQIFLIGIALIFQEFRAKTFAAVILIFALFVVTIPNIINHFKGKHLLKQQLNT
ncbi:MAG TPA: MraY family glycosyltransferase [Salinivirgaceae bacterium]|nr:MraY family glycosyltransferase [Salinivirgaceae bacterium]